MISTIKPPQTYILLTTTLLLLVGVVEVFGIDSATERRALRRVTGLYGKGVIPSGVFTGTVGNSYNEHASVRLVARKGSRKSRMIVNVWSGNDHIVRLVRLTSKVRLGGRKVVLSGGSVSGTGLLPLGVEVRNGRVVRGTVKMDGNRENLNVLLSLRGIDLADSNNPVSGQARVRATK